MATIMFDTHKFVRRLQEADFEEKQAEAISEAFKEASDEAELATKRDIERLEARFAQRRNAAQMDAGILLGGVIRASDEGILSGLNGLPARLGKIVPPMWPINQPCARLDYQEHSAFALTRNSASASGRFSPHCEFSPDLVVREPRSRSGGPRPV